MIFTGAQQKETPALIESSNNSGWVNYGEDNKFGDYLWNLYTKSSTLKAIVDSIVDYSNYYEGAEEIQPEIIEKIIFDYVLFGGFSLQLNYVLDYRQIKYVDFKNLRTNKEKNYFWYSQDWSKYSRVKALNYIAWSENEVLNEKTSRIFWFPGNKNRDGKVYPQPRYSGAIEDIETNVEISHFWKSAILNNLDSSAIISFNNGIPSEEEKREIERKINSKFCGSDNAGKTIITFNDSPEQAPTIVRVGSDDFDTKYQNLVVTVEQRIFTAFRINPILCGINVQTGFSKQEFEEAYDLAYITVIEPIQKTIKNQLEKIGIDIKFKKKVF